MNPVVAVTMHIFALKHFHMSPVSSGLIAGLSIFEAFSSNFPPKFQTIYWQREGPKASKPDAGQLKGNRWTPTDDIRWYLKGIRALFLKKMLDALPASASNHEQDAPWVKLQVDQRNTNLLSTEAADTVKP